HFDPPHRRHPGLPNELGMVVRYYATLQSRRADLLALRAWLALEAGDLETVRQCSRAIDKLLTLRRVSKNVREILTPPPALMVLCRQRINPALWKILEE